MFTNPGSRAGRKARSLVGQSRKPVRIRGTTLFSGNITNVACTFPAGACIGDEVIMVYEHGYGPGNTPTGVSVIAPGVGATVNLNFFSKILTQADLTAGSFIIPAGGSFQANGIGICLHGRSGGVLYKENQETTSTNASSWWTGKQLRAPACPEGSAMIAALALRGTATLTCSPLTQVQASSNANGSVNVFTMENIEPTGQEFSPNFSAYGSQGVCFGYVILLPE